jgi:hypothetical protein
MAGRARHQGAPEGESLDTWVAALTRGGQDRAESRRLDPFVGRWAATTEWEPVPGRGVRTSQATVGVGWVLGGRLMEMRSFDPDGGELSRLLVAFDPSRGDYAGFTATVLSTHFEVERGHFDDERRALVLDGEEPGPPRDPLIHYRRTMQLDGDDRFVVDISYPDVPPGTYGPMRITHDRVG